MAERNRGRGRVVLAVVAAGGAGVAFWRRSVAGRGAHVSDVFQAEVPARARVDAVPDPADPAGSAGPAAEPKPLTAPEERPRGGFAPEPAKPAALFDPDRT
ncbi:hypothetical protein [Pseudonocardia sp. T1-2H]|uniref:hypothetical protein n=1 Tax=Pseudonocardia sp. T1-2H TaxID=3128899 RepID=UPI00310160CE